MFDINLNGRDGRRLLLAVGAGLMFSLGCLYAALGAGDTRCSMPAIERPTLL